MFLFYFLISEGRASASRSHALVCDVVQEANCLCLFLFDHVLDFGLMYLITARQFEHITEQGDHVIIFGELGDLFFSYFHVVSIAQIKVKVKGKDVFILFFLPFKDS